MHYNNISFLINYFSFPGFFFFLLTCFLFYVPVCYSAPNFLTEYKTPYNMAEPIFMSVSSISFFFGDVPSRVPFRLVVLCYFLIMVEHVFPVCCEGVLSDVNVLIPYILHPPHLIVSRSEIICTSEFGSYCFLASC